MMPVITSFLIFILLFVVIGIWSVKESKTTTKDYLLASRNINPWLCGLSAVTTQNSGFMYIGMIGLIYTTGISSAWLLIASMFGSYLAWRFIFPKFRFESQNDNTILGYASLNDRVIAFTGGMLTFIFLGIYAAAQLTAGSKTLHVLFGWETWSGAVLGSAIIVIYCFAGGIRASIWTDAAQSIVTLIAMCLLLIISIVEIGGLTALFTELEAIDPMLVNLVPQGLTYGFSLFLISWVCTGFGMIGQPHIMVRIQAIRSIEEIATARRVYIVWFILFSMMSVGVGLCCRVLLPEYTSFDAELALPHLSLQLLPSVLVGLMLAGIFASTMSTADSQVLACSAAVTQNIFPQWQKSYLMSKIVTLIVVMLALLIALTAVYSENDSVFLLVVIAWGALSAVLGPLMLLRIFGVTVGRHTGLIMMIAGLSTVVFWRFVVNLSHSVFDTLPGMAAGFIAYFLLNYLKKYKKLMSASHS